MNNSTDFTSNEVCYTTESGDSYTYAQILAISKGNIKLAKSLLSRCDWQHPETIFEEWVMEGEITEDGEIINQY